MTQARTRTSPAPKRSRQEGGESVDSTSHSTQVDRDMPSTKEAEAVSTEAISFDGGEGPERGASRRRRDHAYDSLSVKPNKRVSKFADPEKLFPYPDDLVPTQLTTDELSALL